MELSQEEKDQKYDAVLSKLAYEVPREVIKDGTKRAINAFRKKNITRHDYMLASKRDFHLMKSHGHESEPEVDDVAETGKYSSVAGLDNITPPYLRGYEKGAFKLAMEQLDVRFSSFQRIVSIDLGGQLIGYSGMQKLVAQLPRCPLRVLSLTDNNIDDRSLELLSTILRSLAFLEELYLNQNKFTDSGLEHLFLPDTYSPMLKVVNLARNRLTTRSAYYLGLQFTSARRQSELHTIIVGGRVGKNSFGDDYARVLLAFLSAKDARCIKKVDFPESGLEENGCML